MLAAVRCGCIASQMSEIQWKRAVPYLAALNVEAGRQYRPDTVYLTTR